ncbi:MAG: hypothetical protein Q4F02_03555 [Candidatus Saccharibacteria bacterium]|nr:hypothetical protein [Candidatus Saccharibacteria bacterium]
MHRDQSSSSQTRNLLHLWRDDFWRAVDETNILLNLESGDEQREAIVQRFHAQHIAPELLHGEIRAVALSHTEAGHADGVIEVQGGLWHIGHEIYSGIDSIAEQIGVHALTLCIVDGPNSYAIPLTPRSLMAVELTSHEDMPAPIDILQLCRNEFLETINEAENAINYHDGNTDARLDLICDHIDKLDEALREHCNHGAFSGYGLLGRRTEQGDVVLEEATSFDSLESFGFDIVHVDGRWRVVFEVSAGDGNGEVLYIVPDPSFVSQLSYYEQPVDDLREDMEETRGEVLALILSQRFRNASISEQRQMAHEAIADIRDTLARLFNNADQVDCVVSMYRAVHTTLFNSGSYSCAEMAQITPVVEKDGQPLEISGESIEVILPELAELKRPAKIPDDVPLSGGEPMLLIVNESEHLSYLVPFSAVYGLMPAYTGEMTDDEL